MERRMDSGEAKRDGTMAEGGSGGVMPPLPASEQFCTRSCARCGGLLVNEWYYDLHNTGEHSVETLRCVQCGHRVDPVILRNQIRTPVESHQVRQVRQRYSTRTVMLSELA
jgi:Zn ribbon nucleic-acid-binding protein